MPSDAVLFLTLEEALAIHRALVDRFGGPAGVRDFGLLESALYRPRTGHYRDLAEMAAALFEVGSSRVDLQACKLEYSIVSPK